LDLFPFRCGANHRRPRPRGPAAARCRVFLIAETPARQRVGVMTASLADLLAQPTLDIIGGDQHWPTVDAWAASAVVTELIEADLLETPPGPGWRLRLSEQGRDRYGRVHAAIDDVAGRMFGERRTTS
jgi:hypothetical protein